MKNTKKLTAAQIAEALNAKGYDYYCDTAKAWQGGKVARVYFGKSFVTVTDDEITNIRPGYARSLSIGEPVMDAIEEILNQGEETTEEVVIETKEVSSELPVLSGSEKQIAWANEIRQGLIAQGLPEQITHHVTKAGWYIENRDIISEFAIKRFNQLLAIDVNNHPKFAPDQLIAFKQKYGNPEGLIEIALDGVEKITKNFFNL